ncbi:cob(I)yrinic acid a,c-diamide adenosyltransferase [Thiohalophilus sp.]|uniref:cob(I)yrinic acid a,c-diamide adenosyltransferase n=1 Tax=Thiohalophilus sp. TaxID=3028392 RepID=UPI002ACDF06B|nr:cob(I)yrinic acid a,c-diamide adenosyltransferase [Thiohalophilus sp.]MDZ7803024.1 cob(I)yrinic acid a,c-diamide adenosyltransferase [Thiohalophilus sp.]
MSNEETAEQRYQRRMERKKAVVDEKVARADQDKGLILVHTGNGKGKSSAGFGMLARALGHDMRVGVVQFIKGSFSTGEETFFRRFPEVQYHVMGEGFTWETRDRERDTEMAYHAWQKALAMLRDPEINLILLDEINIALKYKYIPMDEVIDALANKPAMQHVILTGRGAKPELIEIADTVTEMKEIKHAFKAGIRAQQGVEL